MEISSMSVDFSVVDAESSGLNFFTVGIEKFLSGDPFTRLDPVNWLLLSLGIAAVVMIRRKLASRA